MLTVLTIGSGIESGQRLKQNCSVNQDQVVAFLPTHARQAAARAKQMAEGVSDGWRGAECFMLHVYNLPKLDMPDVLLAGFRAGAIMLTVSGDYHTQEPQFITA